MLMVGTNTGRVWSSINTQGDSATARYEITNAYNKVTELYLEFKHWCITDAWYKYW
jgi:hypothetical protein